MSRSFPIDSPTRTNLRSDTSQVLNKITTYVTVEDLQRKDRQQAEMKLALQEQMQEKQKRKQEERQRVIDEDRRQEERIKKDLEEINAEYAREAQSREGFYQPEASLPKQKPEPNPTKSQQNRSPPKANPIQRRGRAPTPAEQRIEPTDFPTRASVPATRLVHAREMWRDKEELIEKNAELQELLNQLKEQSSGMRGRSIKEDFEGIRREALMKSQAEMRSNRDHFRAKPFALVARSLVATHHSPIWINHSETGVKRDYSEIESLEIRQQLGKLDKLLGICGESAPIVASKLSIERVDEPKSLELRSSGRSVPLTFSLRSPD